MGRPTKRGVPLSEPNLAATRRYLRGFTSAVSASDVLAVCLVLYTCKGLYTYAASNKHCKLTGTPLLAQVAFAMTVGAHALLNTQGTDVAQLLMGMKALLEICVRAVARWEVRCLACTFMVLAMHCLLLGPCSNARACMQRQQIADADIHASAPASGHAYL